MGNRFGRNQKRKMRAEIAKLESAYKRESELAKYLRAQGLRDNDTVKRVADVLGEHFAALDPKTVQVDRMIGYLRLPMAHRTPFSFDQCSDFCESVEIAISELEANWMELRADRLTGQQFVLLQSPGGDIGYALSGSAVMQSNADHLAQEVAGAIAVELAKAFRNMWRL
ncbi:hypothetical protein J7J47_16365 [Halomonas sp. ISL-60]|uniref:hypothetical protein n=1 Tax=Halomonas sp. ISL-56 TaxID=2819149 RepID=UPI001BE75248|nr:hypothetical protein [Halomonas sp. ISL-56]MBT2773798.1 hypothetical protein [Halomonas sp. ISL-60]MBT2800018.1 hypothetical protein [Halomonas sp. ISL-56]